MPARTALGATTVLSIVNLGFGGKSKPKVGYATALDMYIILCLFAVFAALVEFACINFIDTFIKRFKKWEEEQKSLQSANGKEDDNVEEKPKVEVIDEKPKNGNGFVPLNSDDIEDIDKELVIIIENGDKPKVFNNDSFSNPFMSPLAKSECVSTISMHDACVSTEDEDFEDLPAEDEEESTESRPSPITTIVEWLDGALDTFLARIFRKYHPQIPQWRIYTETIFVIYAIDDFSRKGFPFVFLCLQILYWTLYLYLL